MRDLDQQVQHMTTVEDVSEMHNVAFLPCNATALHEMSLLACSFVERKCKKPTIIIDDISLEGSGNIIAAQERGVVILKIQGFADTQSVISEKVRRNPVSATKTPHTLAKTGKAKIALLDKFLERHFPINTLLRHVVRRQKQKKAAIKVLQNTCAHILVVGNHRHSRSERPFIYAANKLGIPVLIMPYAATTTEALLPGRRTKDLLCVGGPPHSWLKKAVAILWPGQVIKNNHRKYLFYPVAETIALFITGLLPRNPWWLSGRDVAAIVVAGEWQKGLLVADGTYDDHIHVIGMPSHDVLAKKYAQRVEIASRLQRDYDLRAGLPTIVCALPQLGEDNFVDWPRHWEIVEEVFSILAVQPANVFISLHPKASAEEYHVRADHHGLKILREPLNEVICEADLFIAGFSTTVEWALMFGLEAIVLDFTRFGYQIFSGLSKISVVTDPEAFSVVVEKLIKRAHSRKVISSSDLVATIKLGRLDGTVTDRFDKLFDDLIYRRGNKSEARE